MFGMATITLALAHIVVISFLFILFCCCRFGKIGLHYNLGLNFSSDEKKRHKRYRFAYLIYSACNAADYLGKFIFSFQHLERCFLR